MFREKLVSVIMPVYNAERYLKESIESILKQTYKNFEFIIIDDGSTDESLNIISSYMKEDKRIVLISRENRGIVKSLNEGIYCAQGEYIARMDADDISHLERLEKQVNYLNEHCDTYLLGTNFNIIYEENISEKGINKYKRLYLRNQGPIDRDNILVSISESAKFVHSSIMLRKVVFDIVGVYKEYVFEDLELYFRIAKTGLGIAKIGEELVVVRGRDDSKSSTDNELQWKKEILQMKLQYLTDELDELFRKAKYLIWGADVSGELAYLMIKEMLPEAECLAYIDPMKNGKLDGVPIIMPEDNKKFDYDYIFICTQAGAVPAREFLRAEGKKDIVEFFKIS